MLHGSPARADCPAPRLRPTLPLVTDEHDPNEACLYAAIEAPRERHDDLLRELVAPLLEDSYEDPGFQNCFFVRYADPVWQLRVRVLGSPWWIHGMMRPRFDSALARFRTRGAIGGVVFGTYQREWERYGGPVGMRLAETLFTRDTLACLDLLEAEGNGQCARSRREWSLVFVEDFLDLLALDGEGRASFYRAAHEWAFREKVFEESDRETLEARYRVLRPGLETLLALRREDPVSAYGGVNAARCARRALDASRSIVEEVVRGCAEGSVHGTPAGLALSWTHMHCNRLGFDLAAEAILRYVMCRFHEDATRAAVP